MFKVPGIRTKEGLKVTGVWSLAVSLIFTTFFPDVDTQDVLNTVQEVAQWYKESEPQVLGIINKFLNLTAAGYLINRVKKPKDDGSKSLGNL